MIGCTRCKKKYPVGTLFCLECGQSLVDASSVRTRVSERMVATSPEPARAAPAPARPKGGLSFYIPSSRRTVELPAAPKVTVGRADARSGVRPDVDLSPDDAQQAGVSRMHAAVYHEDGEYFLEDLGSANGTFHQGRSIRPSEPTALGDGDEIRLGGLVLRVQL